MAESIEWRDKANWHRTSSLMALIANCNKDPRKGKPSKPGDFNPYYAKEKPSNAIVVTPETKHLFKAAFVGS